MVIVAVVVKIDRGGIDGAACVNIGLSLLHWDQIEIRRHPGDMGG